MPLQALERVLGCMLSNMCNVPGCTSFNLSFATAHQTFRVRLMPQTTEFLDHEHSASEQTGLLDLQAAPQEM